MREMRWLCSADPSGFGRIGDGRGMRRRGFAAPPLRARAQTPSHGRGQRLSLSTGTGHLQRTVAGAIVALVLLAGPGAATSTEADEALQTTRTVMGWAEHVVLLPWGRKVKARLDTGANTASLHATDIEEFEKDGEDWVRFEFDHEDHEQIEIERPVVRYIRIIGEDRRPVVELSFCLDEARHTAQFSLTDRESLTYPMLLGRRFLADVAIVDPAKRYLTRADCPCRPEEETD